MVNYRMLSREAVLIFAWLFELLLLLCLLTEGAPNSDEVHALLLMKDSLNDPLKNLRSWSTENSNACTWTGVTCGNASLQTSVVKLDLSYMGLSGGLSPEIIRLSSLNYISMSHNNLSGEIPSNLFNMSSLQVIDLSKNLFTGKIPRGFSNLNNLQFLDLSDNALTGNIPTDIGNQSALLQLRLRGNNNLGGSIPVQLCSLPSLFNLSLASSALVGNVPDCLGNLSQLQWVYLGWNMLSGPIPASLGNLQDIFWLDLSSNFLTGQIPSELGKLSNLTKLELYNNNLSGKIPSELGNLSRLKELDVSNNSLTGRIPDELSGLVNLRLFHAYNNSLTGSFPLWLANLSSINEIVLFHNFLSGTIPETLGRSSALAYIDLSTNYFSGAIPQGLCQGGALYRLILFSNRLTGALPDSLGTCRSLARLRMENNNLTGSIPQALFSLPALYYATLSKNLFNGSLDIEAVKTSSLQNLDLSDNLLSGNLTSAFGTLTSLVELSLSNNLLHGSIPKELGTLRSLEVLDLSQNELSEGIPSNLSSCTKLVNLNLSSNALDGTIPSELGDLEMLGILDLSKNLIQGGIPSQLSSSDTLEFIDLSFNNLSGPVPQGGVFLHLNETFLQGNPYLCQVVNTSGILKFCAEFDDGSRGDSKKHSKSPVRWVIASCTFFVTLTLVIYCSYWFRQHYLNTKEHDYLLDSGWQTISFQLKSRICLEDIQECLQERNIIGKGSTGTVYRGAMKDGRKIAVKRICIRQSHGQTRDRGFTAEMKILGTLRHRNIVELLGCFIGPKENLLVQEYMPNGSLGDCLHNQAVGQANFLDWNTRFSIALGTAHGLLYLHEDCVPPVLHRDIKCHNILLDEEFQARLADFGLAKFKNMEGKPETNSIVAGSHGYIAPEYAYSLKVDEKADVYSFGVIILELITGRHPTDHMETCGGMDIVHWLRTIISIHNIDDVAVEEITDKRLKPCDPCSLMEIKSLLKIGIMCTSASPLHRPSMQQVVNMLLGNRSEKKFLVSKIADSRIFDSDDF